MLLKRKRNKIIALFLTQIFIYIFAVMHCNFIFADDFIQQNKDLLSPKINIDSGVLLGLFDKNFLNQNIAKLPTKIMLSFFSNIRDESKIDNPLSITALGGSLKYNYRDSVDVAMIHHLVEGGIDGVISRLQEEKPEILGMSLGFGSLPEFFKVMQYVNLLPEKERPLVIVGNIVAAYNVNFILERFPNVFVCMGLGEDAILGIVEYYKGRLSKSEIPNIAYIQNGKIVQNQLSSNTLKNAHNPLSDLLPVVIESGGIVYMETSRGCPFNCAICDRKTFLGGGWEGRDIDEIMEDVIEASSLGVRNINFVDEDLFAGGVERVLELADRIINLKKEGKINKNLIFGTSSSVRNMYKKKDTKANNQRRIEAFKKLYDAGLRVIFVGIESGSASQLRRYGKAATTEENEIAIRLVEDLGIYVVPGFIMLDPLVKFNEIKDNIAFLRRTGMDGRITYPLKTFIPMAKSRLTQSLIKEGLVDENSYITDRLAYEYYFQDEKVANVLRKIKTWEESQAMFFWELKIIFRSSKFGELLDNERILIRGLIDEQTRILIDYLEDMINIPDDQLDNEDIFKIMSAKYGMRLMKDMVETLSYIKEGRLTISTIQLKEIICKGLLREIIRLYYPHVEFSAEDIVERVKNLFGFNLDFDYVEKTIYKFKEEGRIILNPDSKKYSIAKGFWIYRDIPWPDLPRPAKATATTMVNVLSYGEQEGLKILKDRMPVFIEQAI